MEQSTPSTNCSVELYGGPNPLTMSTGVVRIHVTVTRKYRLLRRPSSLNGAVRTMFEEVSPQQSAPFEFPFPLLALPALRELCVTNAIRNLGLDSDSSNFLRQRISSFAADLAARYRFMMGFDIVAQVEVVKTVGWVGDEEEETAWLLPDELMGIMDGGDFVMNRGASSSTIEKLMKEGRFDGGDIVGECMVCLEEVLGGAERTIKMPCSHLFHGPCIARWLEQSNSCPICRYEIID